MVIAQKNTKHASGKKTNRGVHMQSRGKLFEE
jgi:hypothetical protein